MEAARQPDWPRDPRRLEHELVRMRPFGEAYVMKNFGESLAYADAEDAVSDVTLRLHRQIAAGNPPENLQAAFLTGCRNAAIDRVRRHARKPTVDLEAVAESADQALVPEQEAERSEMTARIREVLARTSPRQRQVLILRFGLGLTVPEIAERMDTSLPAAKNLLARGIGTAREHLEAIQGEGVCAEVQASLRSAVLDRQVAGLADENQDEARQLRAHLDHCGSCKSFLASLHRNLNEIGSGALASSAAAHSVPLSHFGRWADSAASAIHAAAAKARLAAYKLGGFGTDGSGAGALAGTGQKVAALCAGAATTTCLATGIVGPGVGAIASQDAVSHHHSHPGPAHTRRLSTLPAATLPEAEPPQPPPAEQSPSITTETQPDNSPQAQPQPQPEPEPTPTPAEQSVEEFGVEGTAPPPEQAPAPAAPPPSSGTSSGSGGAGGEENFGFGG